MAKSMRKGQLFSLDLVIAMGLATLAIGMLLNYYSIAASTDKETREQNELGIIAMNATSQLLEKNRCQTDFLPQGYKQHGCVETTPGAVFSPFKAMTKADMMVPRGYGCDIPWTDLDDSAKNGISSGCTGTTNLVGHWRFDEGEGALAYDSSGYGRTATLQISPSLPEWVGGGSGKAVFFYGT